MRHQRLLAALALAAFVATLLAACTSESDRLYRRAKDAAKEEGDIEYAIELVSEAILVNPEDGRYHRRLGAWLEDLGRYDEALAAYDGGIAAAEPSTSSHFRAIELCLQLGRLDEAERRIQAASAVVEDLQRLEALQRELQAARAVENQTQTTQSESSSPEAP